MFLVIVLSWSILCYPSFTKQLIDQESMIIWDKYRAYYPLWCPYARQSQVYLCFQVFSSNGTFNTVNDHPFMGKSLIGAILSTIVKFVFNSEGDIVSHA